MIPEGFSAIHRKRLDVSLPVEFSLCHVLCDMFTESHSFVACPFGKLPFQFRKVVTHIFVILNYEIPDGG